MQARFGAGLAELADRGIDLDREPRGSPALARVRRFGNPRPDHRIPHIHRAYAAAASRAVADLPLTRPPAVARRAQALSARPAGRIKEKMKDMGKG